MTLDPNCPFCTKPVDEIIFQNRLAKSFYDTKPANPGHILVVPKAHVKTIFDCSAEQFLAIRQLILKVKRFLDRHFQPAGYQIGMNCYPAGGQSVLHAHVHIIPRYQKQGRRQIFPLDKSDHFDPNLELNNPKINGNGLTVQQAWPIEKQILTHLKAKGEKVTLMTKYFNSAEFRH